VEIKNAFKNTASIQTHFEESKSKVAGDFESLKCVEKIVDLVFFSGERNNKKVVRQVSS